MTAQSFANPFRPYNPFLAAEDQFSDIELEVADENHGEVSYALVQSGPAVSAEETESHLDAVEVKISWGTQVLSTTHLEAGKGFTVGDAGDFVLPNAMGTTTLVSTRGMSSVVSIPVGASATLFTKGESARKVNGGDEIELQTGMRVSIELEPVTIEVAAVRAGKKFEIGFLASLATGAAAAIGLSALGHTAIVASLALFMPHMNADDAEAISRDQMLTMQAMLNASAEREAEAIKEDAPSTDSTGGGATGGEPHKGEAGKAGSDSPKVAQGHMSFHGSDDRVQLSRREELQLAREGGFIGMLRSGMVTNGPTSPWGADNQLGQDAEDHRGDLFGANIGDSFGSGLGLSGVGEGGGKNGEGIGIDGIGSTVGGGGGGPGKWGYGKGDKDGIGNGRDKGLGGRPPHGAPTLRPATTTVNGKLPPEVIQRIVRQNMGRFRLCYEAGLRGNPTLSGRITTKFVIGRDGSVSQAADGGSDMPNQEVTSCVVRSFQNLSFPSPDGGIATVIYPIVFTPGE